MIKNNSFVFHVYAVGPFVPLSIVSSGSSRSTFVPRARGESGNRTETIGCKVGKVFSATLVCHSHALRDESKKGKE